jgi:NADPH:quinone reductase-like Zn-dependent oxidoreductase
MRVISAKRYGEPDVLELTEMPRPELAGNDLLVRVRAAGTNPVDAECRVGQAAAWFDEGPYIWGWDVSGVVAAVGEDVTAFVPGDEVFGMPRFPAQAHAYAEYVSAPADEMAVKPRRADHVTAAGLPLCGLTALQVLDRAGLSAGQRAMVNGAAGGVGHMAVQLAKARGAHVIAVARGVNHDFVRGIGADEVVDYTTTAVADAVSDVDVVVDCVGDDSLLRTVRPGGVLAPVPGAARGPGPLEEAAAATGVRVLRHVVHPDGRRLAQLARLVDDGVLSVEVSRTMPLEQAEEAHRIMESGHGRGKIVLTVA